MLCLFAHRCVVVGGCEPAIIFAVVVVLATVVVMVGFVVVG